MAALILPSRRVVQPQGPVEVDWGNPLARAANVWTPQQPLAFQSANNIQTATEVAYSAAPISAAGVGRQWTRTGNAGINFGVQQIIRQNTGVTVLVLAAPRSQAALKVPVSQRVAGGAFTQTELVFNSQDLPGISGATAGAVMLASYHNSGKGVVALSQLDGQPHCWVAGNSTTAGYIFRDGVNQTLSASLQLTDPLTISTQRLRIGNIADDGGTTYVHDDPLYLVVVWDRMLSEPEARAVSANPWQLFRPIQRRIWVPAGGGGPVTHATSGDLVGPGAVVVGSAARIAGTVTHATSGILVGSGAVVTGSAARLRVFQTSGALIGQGAVVTGAAARFRAFQTSGALVGSGAIVTGAAARSGISLPVLSAATAFNITATSAQPRVTLTF